MNVSRLSEEQFPPVETQHPVRRRTRIYQETHFHQTNCLGEGESHVP